MATPEAVAAVDQAIRQALRPLLEARALQDAGPQAGAHAVVAAFSGGPDSTALLAGLVRVASELGVRPCAAHLDHGLDADSARRARRARELAAELGAAFVAAREEPGETRAFGREAEARRRRYAFLDRVADEAGAVAILTAHHADDQAETVLLRLAFGSGPLGLAAIAPRVGRVLRPLLHLRRSTLRGSLAAGVEPIVDPTNADLRVPRNRLRARLLPFLEAAEPDLVGRLGTVAETAAAARERLDARLATTLDLRGAPEPSLAWAPFRRLPPQLADVALSLLHRRAGHPYPAPATARAELRRQLARGRRIGCDCGDGWRWTVRRGRLRLGRAGTAGGRFTYTFAAPECPPSRRG